jgi:membrane protease YdiL (CAAX protease family)
VGTIPRVLSGQAVALRVVGVILCYLLVSVVLTLPILLVEEGARAELFNSPVSEAALLVPSLGGILAVVAFTARIDRRPVVSLGLEPRGALGRWLRGVGIAALMMGCIVLVWYTLVDGAVWSVNADLGRAGLALLAGLVAFLVQGPSEEILFRGYILQIVTARWNLAWGIGVSAALFAAAHAANTSFGLLPMVNLVLFGVATGAYKMLIDDDQLWGVFAIHSVWNWLQQDVFGLENSGNASPIANTLFHVEPNRQVPDAIWGGGFGPEGTLAATLVLLALLVRVLVHARRRWTDGDGKQVPPETARSLRT